MNKDLTVGKMCIRDRAAVSNREALVKKIANQIHLRVSSDRAQHKRDLKPVSYTHLALL